MNETSVSSLERKLTIFGEHLKDVETGDVDRRDIEEKEDPSVLVSDGTIYFRDSSWVSVAHNGKLLASYMIDSGTQMDKGHDKITASKISLSPPAFDISVSAKSSKWGGGGYNVADALAALSVPHGIDYIALHPAGSPKPDMPNGVSCRIIEKETKECPVLQNLIISRVVDHEGKPIVKDRRIIRHPRPTDMDFEGKLELCQGLLLVDSVGYEGLVKSAVEALRYNNRNGKPTIGVAALTEKMTGDIAYTLLSAGFTIVMNEAEACLHANALAGYLNLKPFSNGGVDMDSIILAVQALQSLRQGAEAPIYVTMGKQGCMCVDADGKIYLGGIMREDCEPKSTLGAGDAWAAGLVEGMFHNHKGIESTLHFATAVARAKIDGNLSREYIGELLASAFPFAVLPESLDSYASAIRSRRGTVLDFEQAMHNSENRLAYYMPSLTQAP